MFRIIDSKWGLHMIDRYASSHNAKLDHFISGYLEYNTEAVDVFTVDWSKENNYWCSPILGAKGLHHARTYYRCMGTL